MARTNASSGVPVGPTDSSRRRALSALVGVAPAVPIAVGLFGFETVAAARAGQTTTKSPVYDVFEYLSGGAEELKDRLERTLIQNGINPATALGSALSRDPADSEQIARLLALAREHRLQISLKVVFA